MGGDDVEKRIPCLREDVETNSFERNISLVRPKGTRFTRAMLRLLRQPTTFTLHLDPLGSDVVRLMDGSRNAQQILVELKELRPDEEDLGPRLGAFLSRLIQSRFIRLQEP